MPLQFQPIPCSYPPALDLSRRCFVALREVYRPRSGVTGRGSKGWQSWGAVEEGRLLAVIDARVNAGYLELSALAVEPAYRRRGLARALIDAVHTHLAPDLGASLWCVEQTGNLAIFDALGFQPVWRGESAIFILPCGATATEVKLTRPPRAR